MQQERNSAARAEMQGATSSSEDPRAARMVMSSFLRMYIDVYTPSIRPSASSCKYSSIIRRRIASAEFGFLLRRVEGRGVVGGREDLVRELQTGHVVLHHLSACVEHLVERLTCKQPRYLPVSSRKLCPSISITLLGNWQMSEILVPLRSAKWLTAECCGEHLLTAAAMQPQKAVLQASVTAMRCDSSVF